MKISQTAVILFNGNKILTLPFKCEQKGMKSTLHFETSWLRQQNV